MKHSALSNIILIFLFASRPFVGTDDSRDVFHGNFPSMRSHRMYRIRPHIRFQL